MYFSSSCKCCYLPAAHPKQQMLQSANAQLVQVAAHLQHVPIANKPVQHGYPTTSTSSTNNKSSSSLLHRNILRRMCNSSTYYSSSMSSPTMEDRDTVAKGTEVTSRRMAGMSSES